MVYHQKKTKKTHEIRGLTTKLLQEYPGNTLVNVKIDWRIRQLQCLFSTTVVEKTDIIIVILYKLTNEINYLFALDYLMHSYCKLRLIEC